MLQRFLRFVFGRIIRLIKWLALIVAALPLFAVLEYSTAASNKQFHDEGLEAVADVTGGRIERHRRRTDTYSIDLAWRDTTGTRRKAEGVTASREIWQRLTQNGAAAEPKPGETVKILYLPASPTSAPKLAERGRPAAVEPLTAAFRWVAKTLHFSVLALGVFWLMRKLQRGMEGTVASTLKVPRTPITVRAPGGQAAWADIITERTVSPMTQKAIAKASAEIMSVAPGSIAAAAGLKPGMVALTKGLADNGSLMISPLQVSRSAVKLLFADPARNEQIALTTMGYPHGLQLRPTIQTIVKNIDTAEGISNAATRLLNCTPGDAKLIADALAPLLLQAAKGVNRDYVRAVYGSALAISGNPSPVLPMIEPILNPNYEGLLRDPRYTNIFLLGLLLGREAQGAPLNETRQMLATLARDEPDSTTIAFHLDRLGLPRAHALKPHTGKPFPIDYALENRDPAKNGGLAGTGARVSFREAIQRLGNDQLLLVIALGDYRTNGYQSKLMYELAAIYGVLGAHLPAVHIITSFNSGVSQNPYFFGERYAVAQGVPVTILTDPGDTVSGALRAMSSPAAFLVDRHGIVVEEDGFVEGTGFWTGLAKAGIADD